MAINANAEGSEPALSVDMTPLIDVVFLLLIFFMTVSAMNEMERKANVELPKAFQARIEKNVAKERMVVNVEKDGTIVMFNQDMNMAMFQKNLKKYAAGLKKLAKRSGSAPIVIRGHKDCPYRHVKKVLGAIYDQRFEKIMFAAYQREQQES